MISGRRASLSRLTGNDWKKRTGLARLEDAERSTQAWMIAGVVAVGLTAWALYQLGPELRRYLKMRSM
jgi:hypothetical protein